MNEVLRGAVEALRGSPVVFAMILLNVLFIGAGLLYLRQEQRQMEQVLAACLDGKR